uniref:Heparanase-like n=1 Tax=Petromyzon marinus TaxID=7757 RepID=A0AAJ7SWE3_PETMA|nr:heparanase-like [Petromyzon marinus]XP_032806725.1 heparanase-like [Petromyzon marinus]XP_032806726.1 heparanase-like [Petromyzon marinus]
MEGATLRVLVCFVCAFTAAAWRDGESHGESRSAPVRVALNVDTSEALHALSPEFLSFAIDASVVENGWIDFLRHVRLVTLAKALTPAFLRFGGTRQDFLIFQPESGSPSWVSGLTPSWENNEVRMEPRVSCRPPLFSEAKIRRQRQRAEGLLPGMLRDERRKTLKNITMTGASLDELLGFSSCSGLRLVFGLNALLRGPAGAWDHGNAWLILRHVHARGQDRVSWELGNEPNSYPHVAGRQLSGAQLGADFLALRTLLRSGHPAFPGAKLYGPDITRPRRSALTLLTGFLDSAKDAIEAVTWHQYYMNGRTATLDNFMDPQILDSLAAEISAVQEVVNKEAPGKAIWLGETSSAWGGGAPGLSDTFVAGFMWLDKLGMAARMGVDVVVRQAFFGHGSYNLVDDHLNPLPDYWLSLLHKRLVGAHVLRVEANGGAPSVRVYGHCSSTSFPAGSVTLFALNLGSNPASLSLRVPLSEGPAQGFLLLPADPGAGLRSRTVMLNGTPLWTQAHGSVPETPGVPLPPGSPLALPARALAFFVLPDAGAPACLQRGRNAQGP